MRILLTSNASYVPARGGATRANLAWLAELGFHGHTCRIVASALAGDSSGKDRQLADEEIDSSSLTRGPQGDIEVSRQGSITVYAGSNPARRAELLRSQIREFNPDWVLVSSEDIGQHLLREAMQAAQERVIYLAHTPQFFPFGPASWHPDDRGTALIRECAAAIAIGDHTTRYIEQHAERSATVIHPPMYGGPRLERGGFEDGLITMINPCAVKGISIFLELAALFPEYRFGALPGWGTTTADRAALERLSNVTLLANVKHIGTVLGRTRVLLMPSLWYEGFGLSVMEAMLHGIPALASDSGGLVDAKMGTRFLLPVRLIERYSPVFDERGLPKPDVPPQDIGCWADALQKILTDQYLYEEESETSRAKATQFVKALQPRRLEHFLEQLSRSGKAGTVSAPMPALSPEKREILLRRLRQKGMPSPLEPR